jgi:hypothetical protein
MGFSGLTSSVERQGDITQMNPYLGHASFVEHHSLIHQVHPVVHLNIQDGSINRKGQRVAPVEGIAFGLPLCCSHHIPSGSSESAVAFVYELPDSFFCGSVGIEKVFIQDALTVVPLAFHLNRKPFNDFSIAVGEDSPCINDAIEIGSQVERWFF